MSVSTFEGKVENGQIRLIDEVKLPEQARVYDVVPDVELERVPRIRSPRLVHPEQSDDFIKQVVEVLPDADL